MTLNEAKIKTKMLLQDPSTTNSEVQALYTVLSALEDFQCLVRGYAKIEDEVGSHSKKVLAKYDVK